MDQKCFYACSCCDWDSKAIDLVTTCADSSLVETAAAELGKELLNRRSTEKQLEQFQATLKALEAVVLEEVRRKKQPNHIFKDPDGRQPWSLEALNKSLEKKKSTDQSSKGLGEITPVVPRAGAISVMSLLFSPNQLPIPIPLRPRKSRRCLAELAEGRPGILVKPKLNPLEGDTSLRSSHGQWFKKDSSAILVLPRVRVEKQHLNAMLLVVHNPTLGAVKLSFGPSTYAGEPMFENPSQRTPHLNHIIVDSLRNAVLDDVTLDTSFRAPTSDIVSLDAVEDSFLELGGNAIQIPELVQGWTSDKLGWIAQQGDTAWFALDMGESGCVALAMNIDVAKGSWESSLIKSDQKGDVVTFDMVLIRTIQHLVSQRN